MKKKSPNLKKVNSLINISVALWSIVIVLIVSFLRVRLSCSGILLYVCMIPVYMAGIYLMQKVMEHSKWSRELELLNQECEEEERKKLPGTERPDISRMLLIALFGLVYAIFSIVELVQEIISYQASGRRIMGLLPQCMDVLTILVCCAFICPIIYNVRKGRVFYSRNSTCIYGVGATIIFSALLQSQCWDSTPMVPNSTVMLYYILFGAFILFFGKLYDIAVEMKNEQDLTI